MEKESLKIVLHFKDRILQKVFVRKEKNLYYIFKIEFCRKVL